MSSPIFKQTKIAIYDKPRTDQQYGVAYVGLYVGCRGHQTVWAQAHLQA